MGDTRTRLYQALAFTITFFTYVSIHACRSTWSYAKPQLQSVQAMKRSTLGNIDFVFLFCYAAGSYGLGWMGDKVNLKYFLAISTLGSSLTFAMIALPPLQWDFFNTVVVYMLQAVNGIFQSMAWPGLIAVMGNWVGPDNRGNLMGIWSGNANLGNIIGYQIGSLTIDHLGWGWEWCLLSAAIFQFMMCLIILSALFPYPSRLHISIQQIRSSQLEDSILNRQVNQPALPEEECSKGPNMKFIDYLRLPGVLQYCLGYLGVKASTYGILFWLPDYLKSNGVGDQTASISQVYELSQFAGGFLIGLLCDKVFHGKKSIVLPFCLVLCSISYFMVRFLADDQHLYLYYLFLVMAGINIGAPYNLISSCITADIGNNPALVNNRSAVSSITSIIEGTGSFGAALIMILIPYVQDQLFYLFSGMVLVSAVVFLPLAYQDYRYLRNRT